MRSVKWTVPSTSTAVSNKPVNGNGEPKGLRVRAVGGAYCQFEMKNIWQWCLTRVQAPELREGLERGTDRLQRSARIWNGQPSRELEEVGAVTGSGYPDTGSLQPRFQMMRFKRHGHGHKKSADLITRVRAKKRGQGRLN